MSLMAAGLAAAAASAISQGVGAAAASKANSRAIKAMEESIKRRESILQNWYNNEANQDPLNRASSVRAITQLRDIARQQSQAAQGYNTIMGGSDAQAAAQKEANAKMIGEAMSGIAASAEQRKDAVKDQYLQGQLGMEQEKANLDAQTYQNQAAAIQQAAQGVTNAASSAFSAYAAANSPTNTAGGTDTNSGIALKKQQLAAGLAKANG